jgi:hypothetical protein
MGARSFLVSEQLMRFREMNRGGTAVEAARRQASEQAAAVSLWIVYHKMGKQARGKCRDYTTHHENIVFRREDVPDK